MHWLPIETRITYKLCRIMHLVHANQAPQYLAVCVQTDSKSTAVDQDSDLPTQLPSPSRVQELSSESAAGTLPDLLPGIVSQTIFITSVTLVSSNAASQLNYSKEHIIANFYQRSWTVS